MAIAVLIGLVVLASVFIAWPWLVNATPEKHAISTAQNTRLWQEQSEQLHAQWRAGDIDKDEFEWLKLELDKRLLDDTAETEAVPSAYSSPWLCVALVVFVAAFGLLAYLQWGASTSQTLMARYEKHMAAESPDVTQLLPVLADMRVHGVQQGEQGAEWLAFAAKGYMALAHYRKAAATYDELLQYWPSELTLLASAAQAHYLSNNRQLTETAKGYIDHALLIDPKQPNILGFAGMASFEAGDYLAAVEFWQRLMTVLPASEQQDSVIANALQEAKRRAGIGQQKSSTDALPPEAIVVHVSLAEGIHAADNTPVFVIAKAVDGPSAPLAVKRLLAADLPTEITLTSQDAMAPAFTLTQGAAVTVKAKLSLSGEALSQAGDVESSVVSAVAGDAAVVALEIERVLP